MFVCSLIEKMQSLPTPFYYYDECVLLSTLNLLKSAADKYGYHVHYAVKANSNRKILKSIQPFVYGVDCVSGNEILRSVEVGYDANKIVFAGVGKTDQEILLAMRLGIMCFNCESLAEIEVINSLAKEMGLRAKIAVRINPDIDAKTHRYITTGVDDNKFGISMVDLEVFLNLLTSYHYIDFVGLHFHVGSQITNLDVYKALCLRINEIQDWLKERKVTVPMINVGGGLGVDYQEPDIHSIPQFDDYFQVFSEHLKLQLGQELHFELGRSVVAQCGTLLSKVLFVKEGVNKKFVILDAGMTELMRPALYDAFHYIQNLTSTQDYEPYDVVGPVCESSDCFGHAVELPKTQRNDLIAIRSVGAYGEVMASEYNLRNKISSFFSWEI